MAQNKMLIDASHTEETRVAVVRGNKVEEFDFESSDKRQLRGNIYLAKVTRVEPSLQAAFVDYGGNRHGFLAFSEIHPDYYQIPVADRQALLEEEEAEALDEDIESFEDASEDEDDLDDSQDDLEVEAEEKPKRKTARRGRKKTEKPAKEEPTIEADTAGENNDDDDDDELPPFLAAIVEDDNSISEPVSEETEEAEKPAPKKRGRPRKVKAEEAEKTEETAEVSESDEAEKPKKTTRKKPAAKKATTKSKSKTKKVEDDEAVSEEPITKTPNAEDNVANEAGKEDRSEPTVEADSADVSDSNDDENGDGENGDGEKSPQSKRPRRRRTHRRRSRSRKSDQEDNIDADESGDADEDVDVVGVEDALEEVPVRRPKRRQYKIQEVIKRRQVILIQIVKEERGNKGAALTTYLSLAGRYSVLMPNTARGGGISRKITNASDRKRLKAIANELDVAKGMGVILRTAGANLHKDEIKRDFEYLLRLWENVRQLTLQSTAPCLVYEEGSLIKRSIRDLYNKDISEILVAGEEGYREAKEFMSMLMPNNAKHVKLYRGSQPIFAKYDVENQLDKMMLPQVTMKSGGYLVINQTEALVAIDINSGRSTKEHSIEDTALQTNLEAADEIARQLRLRDLAGLIVIDFIDMEENRNNRAVEKRLKEALKTDRARIQVGRISHFGLLEMSRQRMRASVLDSTTLVCPSCEGAGHVRSPSSIALHVLRSIEQHLIQNSRHNITVKCNPETALFILNQKRESLTAFEARYGVSISIEMDHNITTQYLDIIRGDRAQRRVAAPEHVQMDSIAHDGVDEDSTNDQANANDNNDSDEGDGNRRKRRRRRRRGNDRNQEHTQASEQNDAGDNEEVTHATSDDDSDGDTDKPKRRRRGKRGGRKQRQTEENIQEQVEGQPQNEIEAKTDDAVETPSKSSDTSDETATEDQKPARKKRRTKEEIEADKLKKEAEREANKVAKEAEREAKKATKEAEKAAKKAAKEAEKEAAKALKAAEKEAEKQAKASKTKRSQTSSKEAEIVVTSEGSNEVEDKKPSRGGWWRRKG